MPARDRWPARSETTLCTPPMGGLHGTIVMGRVAGNGEAGNRSALLPHWSATYRLATRMPGLPIRCTMVSVVALRRVAEREQVLLLRRAGEYLHGVWSYVAGHVEAGETGWHAARRELFEETALVPEHLYATSFCEQFYAATGNCIEVVPAFVAMVTANGEVRLNGEHSEYRWLSPAAASDALPFGSQRDLFAYVQREFIDRKPCEALRVIAG